MAKITVFLMTSFCLTLLTLQKEQKSDFTDLMLLNLEALTSDETDDADPIRFKQCYVYTNSTLLPDEPAAYITKCDGCYTTKATMYMIEATCAGSSIIW